MANMETLYGPGSVTTNTSGISLPPLSQLAGGSNSQLMDLFLSRAREGDTARKMEIALRERELANRLQSKAMQPSLFGGRSADIGGGGRSFGPAPQAQERPREDPLQAEARDAALRRQIMADQAAGQQAPMRMVTGPGVTPGLTMDTNAMSADQRRMFLPQGSDFTAIPGFSSGQERPSGLNPEARAAADSGMSPMQQKIQQLKSMGFPPQVIASLIQSGGG